MHQGPHGPEAAFSGSTIQYSESLGRCQPAGRDGEPNDEGADSRAPPEGRSNGDAWRKDAGARPADRMRDRSTGFQVLTSR